ncbi:uncharacterized protein C8Q71DRAFT_77913 [Rhodofomes roseus]|uniref:DUF6533 domain-containing protein n=1 Tax=Rhodofomes roseus TaxID=34475 RepID=A0ABQ8KF41_9APHY|nr:uncharacterized protein C8Q71DRAFT_77913 [Rhodofomes roseus]KAH9836336.1 hypothetical protein C8Q71DRAFT_77913 [Rhodofomes roseus]
MDSIVSVFAGISQARGIHSAAALAWLVYDYALSFEEEVDLIWSSEDTVPKLLYFISRYFGLVVQCTTCANLPGLFCRAGLIWTFISLYILAFCVEFSLMLRVYALYARSRSIFVILSTAFAAETVWVVVLSSIGYADMLRVVTPYPAGWQMKGCFYSSTPVWFRDTWLPLAGFETFLFALMAIKVYSYRPFGEVPILLRVLRDVAFLLCTVAANMSNPFLGVTTTVCVCFPHH